MPRSDVPTAAPFVPADPSLDSLRFAAGGCRGCGLYAAATQTVFGEGRALSPLMLVGEVPGDLEDLAGKPFVGPAGQLLDRALEEAGISRADAYVTNAVKHFSFVERGKRRIHQTPKVIEIRACGPWLEAEIGAVRPQLIVALGATAAKAMLGADFRITKDRGRVVAGYKGVPTLATAHPSAILRAEPEQKAADYAALVADLKVAAAALADGPVPVDSAPVQPMLGETEPSARDRAPAGDVAEHGEAAGEPLGLFDALSE